MGKVAHYRDVTNLECDAVVHLRDGNYSLVEIKIGGDNLINEGAESLKKLRDKIDTTKMKKPSFLMVLIGIGEIAYRRADGVYVVPIGCLKDLVICRGLQTFVLRKLLRLSQQFEDPSVGTGIFQRESRS